jgi:hypothetical protein
MQKAHARPMYTGYPAPGPLGLAGHHPGGAMQGFCSGCGHPHASCCCGCRECRKEAKELLVEATSTRAKLADDTSMASAVAQMSVLTAFADPSAESSSGTQILAPVQLREGAMGLGTAFIGGGCCVHLSVEYTPTGTADGTVGLVVKDSNDTMLMWIKQAAAGLGYQIKEGVVTTKPGATLAVLAVGATIRVRWCEVFSCC